MEKANKNNTAKRDNKVIIKLTSCNTKHEIKNKKIPLSLAATPLISNPTRSWHF